MAGLTYEKAQNVLQAALRQADEIGVPSSVAVVDEGRELVAFARQTGALLASIEISISKAYTACSMQVDTGDLAAMTAPGQPSPGSKRATVDPWWPSPAASHSLSETRSQARWASRGPRRAGRPGGRCRHGGPPPSLIRR
jgi:hypothetical protein